MDMASNLALATPKQQYSLAPSNFEELERFAKIVANSDLAPKDYKGKPGNVMIAVQMGFELGISAFQSLQNISCINGKAALWGDAMLAVCMASPDFVDCEEFNDGKTWTCIVKRKGRSDKRYDFSIEDAKTAHLWGKQGPWTEHPKRMLQMRPRGFALRDAYPDRLRGIITVEEAQDLPPIQATVVQSRSAPPEPLSKEAAALQAAIDAPQEPAIDPELDPEDYVLKSGNKSGTPLGKLTPQQLEYLVNKSRDAEARMYARIVLDQRRSTTPKAETPDDGQGSWLGDQQEGAAP